MNEPRKSGALLLIIAAILFGFMAILAKRAAARISGPEVAFIRFTIGIAICGMVALKVRFRLVNWRGLILRGALGGVAVHLFFIAIAHLPIGIATLLNYTSPIFTALWAAIFLREPIGARTMAALGITSIGVALVIRGNAPPDTFGFGAWQLVGIGSAILSGAAVATIREVRRTDGTWEIFGSLCLIGAIITAGPSARAWITPTSFEWLVLVGMGVTAAAAQILMTYSLGYVRASSSGVIAQLTPVSTIALGWMIYGDRQTWLAITGAIITLLGVTWGALRITRESSEVNV